MTHQKKLFKRCIEFIKTEQVSLAGGTGIDVVGIGDAHFMIQGIQVDRCIVHMKFVSEYFFTKTNSEEKL